MSQELKNYVLDTNILIHSPYAVYAFDEHNVCVSDVTLEELDRAKEAAGEKGANAREAIRIIDRLRMQGSLQEGVPLPMSKGKFRVIMEKGVLPATWPAHEPDNRILAGCLFLQKEDHPVILVSNDILMCVKAEVLGIRAESYRTDRLKSTENVYTGRRSVFAKPGMVDVFYRDGSILPEDLYVEEGQEPAELTIHEFLHISDSVNPKHSALGRFDGTRIVPLKYADMHPYDVTPRNAGQYFLQEALLSPVEEIPLVIVLGAAGSSKTFYSLACGLEQVVNRKLYRKILLSRPNIKFDEDIGYLKGSEEEKIAPLLRPFMDNLELLADMGDDKNYVEDLFDMGYIEAQAMAYMRGRSITDTWMIIDESQNSTPLQTFGLISRAGNGSKVILLGDPDQIDHPRLDSRTNGLVFAADRMKGSPLCAQIRMEDGECVRSPLAVEAVRRMSPKGYREGTV